MLQCRKNIHLFHPFWNEDWKQTCTAPCVCSVEFGFGYLAWASLVRFLTILKQCCINVLKYISDHQKRNLPPPPKNAATNKQNKTTTSTPKPDVILRKRMLNLGAHVSNLELSLLSGELLRGLRASHHSSIQSTAYSGCCGLHHGTAWMLSPGGPPYTKSHFTGLLFDVK